MNNIKWDEKNSDSKVFSIPLKKWAVSKATTHLMIYIADYFDSKYLLSLSTKTSGSTP